MGTNNENITNEVLDTMGFSEKEKKLFYNIIQEIKTSKIKESEESIEERLIKYIDEVYDNDN